MCMMLEIGSKVFEFLNYGEIKSMLSVLDCLAIGNLEVLLSFDVVGVAD